MPAWPKAQFQIGPMFRGCAGTNINQCKRHFACIMTQRTTKLKIKKIGWRSEIMAEWPKGRFQIGPMFGGSVGTRHKTV